MADILGALRQGASDWQQGAGDVLGALKQLPGVAMHTQRRDQADGLMEAWAFRNHFPLTREANTALANKIADDNVFAHSVLGLSGDGQNTVSVIVQDRDGTVHAYQLAGGQAGRAPIQDPAAHRLLGLLAGARLGG